MNRGNGLLSPVGGKRLVGGLGGLYIALATVYPLIPGVEATSLNVHFVVVILTGGPGLGLLYGAHRLPRTDIRHEFFPAIAGWCVGGFLIVLGLLAFTTLAADASNIVANVLILTALGSTSGFIAGSYNGRVKSRERDLQETVEQLRTSNERLEQFAYAASHDLQEPLRMVSSYLQLIERRYGDELDEDGEEFIEFAVDGAERMREMVSALLQYSRVETNGEPLEPVDLDSVLQETIESLTLKIEERGADLTVEPLPTVQGDGYQLGIVFQNLVSNAIIYSEDAPRVHISAERDGAKWIVSVRDEGVGIDPQHQERIFEVFQRLHGGKDQRGTGIGLALSKRIVERHDGDIWVDSEPGEGSTFSFILPAVKGEAGETAS